MSYHLVTVESIEQTAHGLRVVPRIPVQRLASDRPDSTVPMSGDPLELRLPDGTVRPASVALFGIDAWSDGDAYYIDTDPDDPELSLTIALPAPDDLPAGTEVWLPE